MQGRDVSGGPGPPAAEEGQWLHHLPARHLWRGQRERRPNAMAVPSPGLLACLSVFPMAAPCAVGVCWGGSGKWVYFRSSPGSCCSEFVAPGITNAFLRQLAAGDESDRQHRGADPSPAGWLRAMPLAEAPVMAPASAQGEPRHQNASGSILLLEMSL